VGTSVATAQVTVGQTTTKMEFYSIAAEDGQVRYDGYISQVPLVGDMYSGGTIQAFLSFDISLIPKSATVKSASLDFTSASAFGDPFSVLGRLYIYDCKYTQLKASDFVSGMAMPGALYSINTFMFNTQSISSDALVDAIQTRVDEGSNRFQIRLQFEKQQIYRGSSPSTYYNLADYIAFDPARTMLTIEYQY